MFKRKNSQSFLINKEKLKIISKEIKTTSNKIIEIGPGLGALTDEIIKNNDKRVNKEYKNKKINNSINNNNLKKYSNKQIKNNINKEKKKVKIKIIELDKKIYKYLKVKYKGKKNIRIENNSFLKTKNNKSYCVISSIPYDITKKILEKLIKEKDKIDYINIIIQLEYYNNIIEKKGSFRNFLFFQCFKVEKEIIINKDNFYPVPKVDSIFLRLRTKKNKININIIKKKNLFNYEANTKKKILKRFRDNRIKRKKYCEIALAFIIKKNNDRKTNNNNLIKKSEKTN